MSSANRRPGRAASRRRTPQPDRQPDGLEALAATLAERRIGPAARMLLRTDPRWQRTDGPSWVRQRVLPEDVEALALILADKGAEAFAAALLDPGSVVRLPPRRARQLGRVLLRGGRHDEAARVFTDLVALQPPASEPLTEAEDPAARRDRRNLAFAELHRTANRFLAESLEKRPGAPRGYVVLYNPLHPVLTGLMTPMVPQLARDGYPVVAAAAGTIVTPPTGVPGLDAVKGLVSADGQRLTGDRRRRLAHEWDVDLAAGRVATGGIDYHTYFQERLAQKARRYRVDPDDPSTARRFDVMLHQADVALTLCERLARLADRRGRPVRIALMDSHFAPQGVIREWCARVGRHHGVHAVALSIGYENYYSNLTTLEATTLAVEDVTAQPDLRQPFLGGRHRLEAVLADEPELGREADPEVLGWICQDRSRSRPSPASDEVVRTVARTRERGGRAFVALGKVTIDFAAPGDVGHAHPDFIAWITHLVRGVEGTDNLLLVKPHPHEVRPEIAGRGVQPLRDLLPERLPDNVLFLDHDSFNSHELAGLVDAAFLWNGTATLEFPVLGVPVVPGSVWATRDYPIGLEPLTDPGAYDALLEGRVLPRVPDEVARRAAAVLRLMRSEHVAIPYRYLRRPATNQSIGELVLDRGRLDAIRQAPDPFVQRAASRFFEFAAAPSLHD